MMIFLDCLQLPTLSAWFVLALSVMEGQLLQTVFQLKKIPFQRILPVGKGSKAVFHQFGLVQSAVERSFCLRETILGSRDRNDFGIQTILSVNLNTEIIPGDITALIGCMVVPVLNPVTADSIDFLLLALSLEE